MVNFLKQCSAVLGVDQMKISVKNNGSDYHQRFLQTGWKSIRPRERKDLSGDEFENASRHDSYWSRDL